MLKILKNPNLNLDVILCSRVPYHCKLEYISRKLKTEGWKEDLFVAILESPSDRPID